MYLVKRLEIKRWNFIDGLQLWKLEAKMMDENGIWENVSTTSAVDIRRIE